MKTSFCDIIIDVLEREGGFVNDPDDRGGATKFGVTIGTLREHGIDVDGDGDIDVKDVEVMPLEVAKQVYRNHYWEPLKLDRIPGYLRDVMFDMAINHGQSRAVKILQRAITREGYDIAVDGLIGPQTISHAPYVELKEVVYERIYFYSMIIRNDPSQMKFRKGWYNRAIGFLDTNPNS